MLHADLYEAMLSVLHLEKQNDYKSCLRKRRLLAVVCWGHSFFVETNFIATTRVNNRQNINEHHKC